MSEEPKNGSTLAASSGAADCSPSAIIWSLHDQWIREEIKLRRRGSTHDNYQADELSFRIVTLRGAIWRAFGKGSQENAELSGDQNQTIKQLI